MCDTDYVGWILKGHSIVDYRKEDEPDVLNNFVQLGFKDSKFCKEHELIATLGTQILKFLKANSTLNIALKEPKITTITKFQTLLQQ